MSRNYYINGSAVRELDTQPLRRQERPDRRRIEEEQRRKRRRNAARRNRERALYMGRGYVAFLSACVVVVALSAVALVQMQSQVTQRMKNIAAMESQLTDMKADNDARYKEIVTSVDLEYVKEVAINELGMNYATAEQLVYFNVDNQNFMDQYGDIPE